MTRNIFLECVFLVAKLHGLFYLHYTASNDKTIDELERIWKEAIDAQSRYYAGNLP
jgi:hypothetical protein